jgi:hypothetical protein
LSYKNVIDPETGQTIKQYNEQPYATYSTPEGTFKSTGENPDQKPKNYTLLIVGLIIGAVLLAGFVMLVIRIRKGKDKTKVN